MGFVWDRGVAMFINDGGNDTYTARQTSIGVSWSAYDDKGFSLQDQTYAVFIDTSGSDVYHDVSSYSYGYGYGGFFFDLEGTDRYWKVGVANNAKRKHESGVFYDFRKTEASHARFIFWEKAKAHFMQA